METKTKTLETAPNKATNMMALCLLQEIKDAFEATNTLADLEAVHEKIRVQILEPDRKKFPKVKTTELDVTVATYSEEYMYGASLRLMYRGMAVASIHLHNPVPEGERGLGHDAELKQITDVVKEVYADIETYNGKGAGND